MAADGAKGGKAKAPAKEPRPDTEYVVLVKVMPKGTAVQLVEALAVPDLPDLSVAHGGGVYLPVMDEDGKARLVSAPTGEKAIELVSGKGEDAIPAAYKAVAWSAWKGLVPVEAPKQVLQDQRSLLDDE